MKTASLIRLSLLSLGLAASLAPAQADPRLAASLEQAGLRQQDLAFPLLPAERDSFRLARVDEILKSGQPLDSWGDSLTRRLERTETLGQLVRRLWPELRRAGAPATELPDLRPGALRGRDWEDWTDWLGGLGRRRLLEPAQVQVLEQDLGDLLQEDGELGELSVFELDSLQRLSEAESRARRLRLEAVRRPDPAELLGLLDELEQFVAQLEDFRAAADGLRPQKHPLYGPVLYADEFLAVGTEAVNHWTGGLPPIVIDLGGDDLYEGPVALSRGGVSLLLDLQGNDRYRSGGELGPAASVGGLALLLDLAGDDQYEGRYAALGASLGGLALLVDRGGDDLYTGDTFCLGAGSLGMGLLLDEAGNDLYRCSLYGQGFGHVAGLGLLQDKAGHDQYLLQPRYVDQIRYDDHHLSMGQGFGFGQRPDLSGGVGLLHDLAGNDLYSADIFGQGGAYWWALGALVDRAGNDRYLAWQYAQGAGVHLAAGLLLDEDGQDVYQSRGVSQGCGHDLALGWLLERGGDDSYTAWDLSQGAGSANGTGRLTDLLGADLYAMRGPAKPRAYGDPRRRTGSLGLFLDATGADYYLGNGANDSLWSGSLRGLAQDWGPRRTPAGAGAAPALAAAAAADDPGPLDSLFVETDSVDRLYVWAIRLEPKWLRERDLARAALVRRPVETVDLLRRRRLLSSDISWERHALKDVVVALGAAAVPLLEEAVEAPLPAEPGEERTRRLSEQAFALWVFSEACQLGDPARFADWWTRGLAQSTPGSLSLLLEGLAERDGDPQILLEGLRHTHPGVRRSAAWGLGRNPAGPAGRAALLAALADSVLAVRISAFESLAADTTLDGAPLEARLFDPLAPALERRELLRLLARRDPARCRAWLPRLEADPVLAVDVPWLSAGLPPAPPRVAARRRGRS
ncbi:MAG: hypothetical protein WC326_10095 [Candidatus Delongbacteria bacterium]